MKPIRTFDLLDRYIGLFPEQDALAAKQDGKWITWSARQYYENAHHFGCGLLELGFMKGDKIVTITNNRPEWNFVDMGMAMAGVVHVPVYTSMTCEEYRYILEHSDARMVIISERKLYETIKPVCDQVKNVEQVLSFDIIEGAASWTEVLEKGKRCGPETSEKLKKIKKEIMADDVASLIYTSGTTGNSKGVMLSHSNLVNNFIAAAEVFGLTPEDKFLSILPLCHVGGRLGNYQTQYSGATIYYAENMGTIAANLKEIGADGFDAVPRILEKVYDNVIARGRSLKGMKKRIFFWAVKLGLKYRPFGENGWFYERKLKIADRLIFSKWREALGGKARLVGCGGASLQPRLERIFWAAGLKILNMYGLTETSPIITINRQEKPLCRLGSVGAPIAGVEVRIADDGEILCRGHNVMLGYYKDEELTSESIDKEGWFHTGDVGIIEDETFLKLTDRKKEIFKLSNGKFVAPQVIENRLKESLFIDQVMVTGEHQKFACAVLVPDEWSPFSGELSASLKLKRKVIEEKYSEQINQIYGIQ